MDNENLDNKNYMDIELLPCPFCSGLVAHLWFEPDGLGDYELQHNFVCDGCEIIVVLVDMTLEEAVKIYNKRPAEISGPPENVLVDTDDLAQAAFGPAPQWLTKYATDMIRSAAKTLDREIMGEDPDPELIQPEDSPIEKLQKTEASSRALLELLQKEQASNAPAEVWSFINGYEGGLNFEEILKGLQVKDIDD